MLAITPAGLKIVRENIWGKVIGGIIELELQSPEGPDPDHRPGVVRNVPRRGFESEMLAITPTGLE